MSRLMSPNIVIKRFKMYLGFVKKKQKKQKENKTRSSTYKLDNNI